MLPFTTRTAHSAGFTKSSIRRLLIIREWRRLRRNAYIVSRFADALQPPLLQAGSVFPQLDGNPAISHESAATLWQLPHLRHESSRLQLTRDRRSQGRCDYDDVIVHHAELPEGHICEVNDVPITTIARTIVDITRMRGMRAGLIATEASLRPANFANPTPCSLAELRSTVTTCRGWPRVRTVRWVIEHASPLSESPLESMSRAAFYKYCVPQPEQQVRLADDIRVDFLWKNAKIVGESDGDEKYQAMLDAFKAEKAREQRLIDMGFTVLRWGWDEAFKAPEQLSARIKRALTVNGVDVPAVPSSWRSVGRSWFLPSKYRWEPLGWAPGQI